MSGKKVIIIWQSLVSQSYRSFFHHLADSATKSWFYWIVPQSFRELGFQNVACHPFDETIERHPNIEPYQSKVFVIHTQIVIFKEILSLFRKIKSSPSSSSNKKHVVLALAEPFSVTSLFCWFAARLVFGKNKFVYINYTMQNINKNYPFIITLIQNFLFNRLDYIFALGLEHSLVLRKQGYKGEIILFPLWFDSRLFYLQPSQENIRKNFYDLVLTKNQKKSLFSESHSYLNVCDNDLSQRCLWIGYCGSLLEEKGILDFLEASSIVLKNFASENLKILFFVAGTGPLQTTVERYSHDNDCFVYLGKLTPFQVSAYFNALDMMVIPSKTAKNWKEQFGRVIVEAMACGTTVLGSDSGEIPTLIGNNNLIFHEGDIQEISLKMTSVLKNISTMSPEAYRNFRRQISNSIFQKYSDKVVAEKMYTKLSDKDLI